MKASCVICTLLLAAVHASQMDVTPVQKVITLMGGMLEKGKKEKHDEALLYATSRQYCSDQEPALQNSIEGEDRDIFGETAAINKAGADAMSLGKSISSMYRDQDTWTGDKKAAAAVRTVEAADYITTHKDYEESIDAVAKAVAVMKKQGHDRQQAVGSLIQSSQASQLGSLMELGLIPTGAKRTIDLFLQQGEEASALETAAPEANGYEFQATGVIDMLEKLQDKFIDEKANLEKEEANAKHAFALLSEGLTAQIAQAGLDITEKTGEKANRLGIKASESTDKLEDSALRTVDTQTLSDLSAACKMKAEDFEARQRLRTQEIQQIQKGIEVLSGSVSGYATKHLPALMQLKGTSFGVLRSTTNSKTQERVMKYLRAQAKKLNSRILSTLVKRASADPYQKVKKMLKDLVVRLMEEANEEASHKGWCDTELATNKQTRTEKSQGVDTLHAAIDELTASTAKLTEDIKELTAAVASSNGASGQLTTARQAEAKQNKEAISDSQDAQTALAQAIIVLKEFYAKALESTSLIQQPYQGMQTENGGVMAMLEVIESDFARLEADTKANEATSQEQYDKAMTDAKVDRASKTTAIEHKVAKKQDENQALTNKKLDLDETQKSLDAALTYFDKLKPSCVDAGNSYEDRVERRRSEVESLQEALKVMNGEDLA